MVAQLVIALLAGCLGSGGSKLPSGSEQKADIVLVSIDTLRADHLSCYGYGRETSPFIDSLAASGVRFEWARSSSPWTLPSHTTMLTGQLPSTHRVVDDGLRLNAATPVLPERLGEVGFRTAGFVSTLYVSKIFGFDRGFSHFVDFDLHTEKKNLSGTVDAEHVIDAALDWWSDQKDGEPVFLFLHFYDVHYNYAPPPPYDTLFDRASNKDDRRYSNYFRFKKNPLSEEEFEHQIAQYDEEIRYVDDQLKRIADAAAASGRKIRWVITSDHGEEFGERGTWGHAHTLYSEQLRIPLVLSGDGIPKSTVSTGWAASHDLAPTIAAMAGADGLEADGIDLSGFYSGKPLPSRPFLAETTRFKTNRLSLLEDGFRLEWDLKTSKSELFQPMSDPLELNDLSNEPGSKARIKALQSSAESLLGDNWEVLQPGELRFRKSYILKDGRKSAKLRAEPGDRFLLLPYDGQLRFSPDGSEDVAGPFSVGKLAPSDGDPVRLIDHRSGDEVELDEATRKMLEQLGYMQSDDE
jgi:arylsulfatase A-like enzyme